MTALTFTLFEALEEAGVSKEKAKAATEAMERSIAQATETIQRNLEERYAIHSKELATKGDVEKVRLDVEKVRSEVKVEVEKVRLEIEKVRAEMAQVKVDLIKWNVGAIFAAGAFTVTLANFFGK